mmetsp:Transcript_33302/g.102509  ORF Transcript_33302/g.102509 Transcript_33302/m.102509 type:complete len:295 (-) Transcript_33302:81-965(-)
MPSPWDFSVEESDIEDEALPLPKDPGLTFNGNWRATTMVRNKLKETTVTISGTNVWHKGSLYATVRLVTRTTCVLVMKDQDVKGFLSEDGREIEWEDGDVWPRASPAAEQPEAPAPPQSGPVEPEAEAEKVPIFSVADASAALLQRDHKRLADVLEDGVPVDSTVDPAELWQEMRWDPRWTGELPRTPFLVAAMLLQWPEGVEVCVRYGADVNGTYTGPFRSSSGGTCSKADGAPVLQVALSTRGPDQCIICQHLLRGKVARRTFQVVRKRAKEEMDFVTAGFFDKYQGPFLEG